jgi:hypothetical protein
VARLAGWDGCSCGWSGRYGLLELRALLAVLDGVTRLLVCLPASASRRHIHPMPSNHHHNHHNHNQRPDTHAPPFRPAALLPPWPPQPAKRGLRVETRYITYLNRTASASRTGQDGTGEKNAGTRAKGEGRQMLLVRLLVCLGLGLDRSVCLRELVMLE